MNQLARPDETISPRAGKKVLTYAATFHQLQQHREKHQSRHQSALTDHEQFPKLRNVGQASYFRIRGRKNPTARLKNNICTAPNNLLNPRLDFTPENAVGATSTGASSSSRQLALDGKTCERITISGSLPGLILVYKMSSKAERRIALGVQQTCSVLQSSLQKNSGMLLVFFSIPRLAAEDLNLRELGEVSDVVSVPNDV